MAYLVVTPRYVARRSSMPGALKLAAACERSAQARYGAGAGADCAVIAERSDGTLDFRGLACGRRLIGRSFGCAQSYLRQAEAARTAGAIRELNS